MSHVSERESNLYPPECLRGRSLAVRTVVRTPGSPRQVEMLTRADTQAATMGWQCQRRQADTVDSPRATLLCDWCVPVPTACVHENVPTGI